MDNILRLLGLTKKAGLLAIGDESVYAQARGGKAKAVFSASDASDASKLRARKYAELSHAVYVPLPYSKAELGAVIGRGSPGMLASLDSGLASALLAGLASVNPEQYAQTAALLANKAHRFKHRKNNHANFGKFIGNRMRRAKQ